MKLRIPPVAPRPSRKRRQPKPAPRLELTLELPRHHKERAEEVADEAERGFAIIDFYV